LRACLSRWSGEQRGGGVAVKQVCMQQHFKYIVKLVRILNSLANVT